VVQARDIVSHVVQTALDRPSNLVNFNEVLSVAYMEVKSISASDAFLTADLAVGYGHGLPLRRRTRASAYCRLVEHGRHV